MEALLDRPLDGVGADDDFASGGDVAALKVLIADDHPLIVMGIRRALEAHCDLEIVGEAHSGPELLRLVERRLPDVVLTDMRMPGIEGVDVITAIRERFPHVKVVVLSATDDRASIDSALLAGASAYIVKSVQAVDIGSVLREAAAGSVYHAPSRSAASLAQPSFAEDRPLLTTRECAILAAVADGLTTKAISGDLWVSEHTVKFHLTNIYRKLGVSNRSGAVRYALEHGLATAA